MSSTSPSSSISVIIPVLNEAPTLLRTIGSLQATLPAGSEIVVVDDGSTDGSPDLVASQAHGVRLLRTHHIGCPAARNYGAHFSRGDIVVFADAHVETPPNWWQPLAAALADPKVGAVGPGIASMLQPSRVGFGMRIKGPELHTGWLGRQAKTPYPVPILCACFVAMRRKTFDATQGFDDGLIRWGSSDAELSTRLWLLGYEQQVVPQVTVAHLFREKHPYPVDRVEVLHNMLRYACLHLGSERMARLVQDLQQCKEFAAALTLCADSDVWSRRAALLRRRKHDDDWYFNRFQMTL